MKDKNDVDRTCLHWIVTILNFFVCIALCADAIVRFTYFGADKAPTDPFFYIMTFYLIPFAGLFLVAEMQWQRVLKYFQFIGQQHGKGMF